MIRRAMFVCALAAWTGTVGRADDRYPAQTPQTPYAPASAYVAPGTFDVITVPTRPANAPARFAAPAGNPQPGAAAAPAPAAGPPATLPPAVATTPAPVTTTPPAYTYTKPATTYTNGCGPNGACDPVDRLRCDSCGQQGLGWVSAEYLLWAVKSTSTPPLVVGDPAGTARSAVGIPGTPGQRVLSGGSGMDGDLRSGMRLNAGIWLGEERLWALSGDFFFLATGTDHRTLGSPGDPPVSRPFFNTATGAPDAELVSFPGVLSGAVTVQARNTFVGAGAFLQRNLCCDLGTGDPCNSHGYRLDAVVGYRFLEMNDNLSVAENLTSLNQPGVPAGTGIVVYDQFRTVNIFNGGLIGLSGLVQSGRWSADFRGGVSFGDLHREAVIDGVTAVSAPGQPVSVRSGGLLAQPSNIGRYSSDVFTVVPEVGLTLGYQVTPRLRLQAGYTFLYVPNTWRAGDQIDRAVDPVQLRGLPSTTGRPAPTLSSTGTFVQGMNFGMTFKF